MTSPIQSKCLQCEHFRGFQALGSNPDENLTDKEGASFVYFCEAFPGGEGIPSEVVFWDEPHTSPRDDQEGDFVFSTTAALQRANPVPDRVGT